jgi:serine/threonine-protein kinase RsbW
LYNPRVDICTGAGQTTKSAGRGLFARADRRRGRADSGWRMFRVCGLVHKQFAMTELRVSYTLDSTLETVDSAEQTASRIAAESGFDEDVVMQISMAVREAAVNAVLHGNAYDPDKKVKLDFERTGNDLVITIRDQGKGLDPAKIPDPLAPENLLKTSGRGIFLIRSFMDEVQIQPSQTGTEIKLVKHVRGPAADVKEASQ